MEKEEEAYERKERTVVGGERLGELRARGGEGSLDVRQLSAQRSLQRLVGRQRPLHRSRQSARLC